MPESQKVADVAEYKGPPLCPLMYSVTPQVAQNPLDPKRGTITHEPMVHPCVQDACMLFDARLRDCRLNVGLKALTALAESAGKLSASAEDMLKQGDTQ